MIARHGKVVVSKVISGMEKKIAAGESIENPDAYFRSCCQNGWEPTSKNLQEKAKQAEREAREKERQERERQSRAELEERIRQEQADPEVMKRIAEAQAKFWDNLDSAPASATSGHAQPASSFD